MDMKLPIDLQAVKQSITTANPRKLDGLKDKELWKAAKEFEGVFVDMVMKSMRSTSQVMESDVMGDSDNVKFFQEMLDTEYSKLSGDKSRFGLADALYRQFSQKTLNAGEIK